ncbi:MAG: 4Fe-4S binding protein [Candidatus Gorgyraea atricola]|nr:4Fe-4S binding protein [Candidatus Gorgyraea atricola]
MAKRKIVKIDEEKCTGCGLCIPNCAEGALQIIDGKAKLVKEIYCDGLGACLGHCPEDAITIEERESAGFDEKATKKHLEELEKREKKELPCGCPGTAVKTLSKGQGTPYENQRFRTGQARDKRQGRVKSEPELGNWPIQLMLVPVEAPYLKEADLVIAADCVAFSYPDFHQDFLRDKVLLIGCPKLDAATIYEEKLAELFKLNNIKSITVLHMEVPCCFGLIQIVKEALRLSGKKIPLEKVIVGIKGDIKEA